VEAAQPGTAFVRVAGRDLDQIFSIQHERVVNQDNTVSWANQVLQMEKVSWRSSLAGCRVTVYEHLDGSLSIGYGPHVGGRYTAEGLPVKVRRRSNRSEQAA
jgi:hypothetical protein